MNKLTYDPIIGISRYRATMYLNYIKTNKEELDVDICQPIHSVSCTTEVKQTAANWFYILPYGVDREYMQKWVDEFSVVHPHFGIKLLPEGTYSNLNCTKTSAGEEQLVTFFDVETGEPINFKCTIKGVAGFITHSPLLNKFITWYKLKEKTNLIDNYKEYIKEYTSVDKLMGNESCTWYQEPVTTGPRYPLSSDINKNSVDLDELTTYLIKLVKSNIGWVQHKVNENDKDRIILRVLHSKRQFPAESYLIHHLVRAGIAPELNFFINQYYRLKELKPDIFFWDAMMLINMGKNMHYYWWLTGERWFKLPGKTKFYEVANSCKNYNSLAFFNKFKATYSADLQKRIKQLYEEERIEELYILISDSIVVKLKEKKRDRFINLRFRKEYKVDYIQDDYYFINGDDFKVHRYKQSNFDKV